MIPVQFIIQSTLASYDEQWAREALKGGCKWLQLRIDEAEEAEVAPIAKELLALCREQGATFVIEDRPTLVKELQTDGVFLNHLSQPANEVREMLGYEFIIGARAASFDEIKSLKRLSADYIVCNAPSLGNSSFAAQLEFYRELQEQCSKEAIRLPVCASGDFSVDEVMPVIETGMQGITLCNTHFDINGLVGCMQAYLSADN